MRSRCACPMRRSVGAARNAGLATVGTSLVCFLDADDELLPGTLERLRARLAARPSCVASVAASVAWLEGSGETVSWRWPRPLAYRLCRHPRLFAAAASLRNQYPTTGAALMRTEAMRGAGGFADADHEEDWLPGVALAARGRVDLDRRPGRRYRVSDAIALWGRRGPRDHERQSPPTAQSPASRPAHRRGMGHERGARRRFI